MKLLTTKVTYRVPNGCLCNLALTDKKMKVNKEHCRFCVKTSNSYTCVLYNLPLKTCDATIEKLAICQRAFCRTESNNPGDEASQESSDNTSQKETSKSVVIAIKTSIKLFCKTYQELRQQGITEPLALKVAEQLLLGKKE